MYFFAANITERIKKVAITKNMALSKNNLESIFVPTSKNCIAVKINVKNENAITTIFAINK